MLGVAAVALAVLIVLAVLMRAETDFALPVPPELLTLAWIGLLGPPVYRWGRARLRRRRERRAGAQS